MKIGDLVKRNEHSPFCPDLGIVKQIWTRNEGPGGQHLTRQYGLWLAEVWWLGGDPTYTEKVRVKDLEIINGSNS